MKQLLLTLLFTGHLFYGSAQITTPVIRANFGVDADLRCNYFNGLVQSGNDDWFSLPGSSGTGNFIIDTTGAAAILAGYISNPASRMLSFSRLMRQTPYTVLNNRLLLDGIFIRDYHGDDSTVFASGSNKNGMSPVNWSCPVSQGIPDKNDILDVYVHARRAGPNITDSLWMFGGISIENTTGNRYFDFELYQSDFYYDRPTRTFQNYGPDEGHTSWLFNADGSINRPGDIIFTAEFGNSSLTLIEARIWVNKSSLSITPMFFNWGGLVDGASAGSVFGYANILPKTAGAFYTGLQCGNGIWTGAFSCVRQDNSVIANYTAKQFMEISVNLTKLGLDPAYISSNGCGTPFRRVVVKTRASTSFTAELKDFVAPFRMFDYPYPQAVAQVPFFCGEMGVSDISVINPLSSSLYTWNTSNGNIVGTNIGPTIRVDTTGNYEVTQQLHAQCPAYARDTVTIKFDSLCVPLERNLVDFTALRNQTNKVNLFWKVVQNEQILSYTIEYSIDNITFSNAGMVNAGSENGTKSFNFLHNINYGGAGLVYYRLLITGYDGRKSFSRVIAIRLSETSDLKLLVYPNPVINSAYVELAIAENTIAEYRLVDANGKELTRNKINLFKGINTFNIRALSDAKPGMYYLNLLVNGKVLTSKISVTR
jgi:hypothetical protein